jgi:hypothetical protein
LSSEIAIVLARDTRVENTGAGGGGIGIPESGGEIWFPGLSEPQPAALIASDAHTARASLL